MAADRVLQGPTSAGAHHEDAVDRWVIRVIPLRPVLLAVVVDRHGDPHLGAVCRSVIPEAVAGRLARVPHDRVDRAWAVLDHGVADHGLPAVRHAPDLEGQPSLVAGVSDGARDQDRVLGVIPEAHRLLGIADYPHGGIEARRIARDELVVVLAGHRHHAGPEGCVDPRGRRGADAATERAGDGDLAAFDGVARTDAGGVTQVADDLPE